MIEAYLENIKLSKDDQRTLLNKMNSTTQLAVTLHKYRSLNEVLMLLYTELNNGNRPSYVARIYGRYRVLSGDRDKEAMKLWAHKQRRIKHGYRGK